MYILSIISSEVRIIFLLFEKRHFQGDNISDVFSVYTNEDKKSVVFLRNITNFYVDFARISIYTCLVVLVSAYICAYK